MPRTVRKEQLHAQTESINENLVSLQKSGNNKDNRPHLKNGQTLTKDDLIKNDPSFDLGAKLFGAHRHLSLDSIGELISHTSSPAVLYKLHKITQYLRHAIKQRMAETKSLDPDGTVTFHEVKKKRADGKGHYLTVEIVWKENGEALSEAIDISDILDFEPPPTLPTQVARLATKRGPAKSRE